MIRRGRSCAQHALCCVLVLATWMNPRAAGAQSTCASSARGASAGSASNWDGALARRVSLHGRDISLREALDRLSATAHVRLSYTAEELPLSRSVCLTYDAAAVGDVLTDLLDGTSVHPVGAGSDCGSVVSVAAVSVAVVWVAFVVLEVVTDEVVVEGSVELVTSGVEPVSVCAQATPPRHAGTITLNHRRTFVVTMRTASHHQTPSSRRLTCGIQAPSPGDVEPPHSGGVIARHISL